MFGRGEGCDHHLAWRILFGYQYWLELGWGSYFGTRNWLEEAKLYVPLLLCRFQFAPASTVSKGVPNSSGASNILGWALSSLRISGCWQFNPDQSSPLFTYQGRRWRSSDPPWATSVLQVRYWQYEDVPRWSRFAPWIHIRQYAKGKERIE